jgi:hypothetical protein
MLANDLRWILATAVMLGCVTSARASTSTTLSPTADTYVRSNQPNNSFGQGGSIEVSASAQPNGEFQALLRFDLSSAKSLFDTTYGVSNWAIQSAALQLTSVAPVSPSYNPNTAGQLTVQWMANDSWIEGGGTPASPGTDGVTYNSLPTFLSAADQALGTFSYNGTSGSTLTNALASNSSFVSDLAAGGQVSLRLLAADNTISLLFNSSNFGNPAVRPSLTVTANSIPEPAGVLLGVVIGIGVIKRSRGDACVALFS